MDANQDKNISIILNGDPARVPYGLTVSELLHHLGIDPSRIAIELDRCILRRELWDTSGVSEGSRLEIVQFVGGG